MTTYGLQIPNFTYGVPDEAMFDEVVARATAAEESGYSSVWVMDHFYQLPALGGESNPMLEAYTLLGALAVATSRVQLGTLVTGVTYRNPAMLAKIITTLDVISKGRAVLGIGAAWHDIEHEALGFAFPPVKERMDRLEEAVQICRAMFRDEVSSFDGRYYQTRNVRNLPRPVQPGGPPIMIGGGGEKRTLRLVAQYADMCNVTGDADMIRHKIEVIRNHCADVGRDPSEIRITRMATMFLTNSPDETKQVREFVASAAGPEMIGAAQIGEDDDIAAQVKELAAAGVDEFIFNMPLSDAAAVTRAGTLLGTVL
ncbi:MAG: LLM class F420-dependent oxidoreductase [Actinobacteria bacterium]|nr:LLM class F420-dependent oxidoreductase [Actinomycetota bacterium]